MQGSSPESYVAPSYSVASKVSLDSNDRRMFPMMVVLLQTLLEMSSMKSHEELVATGGLVEFAAWMGTAMFISHQWVSSDHPDPKMEQLRILQEALTNLVSGKCQVSLPPAVEIGLGRLKVPTAADFAAQKLFIWFDYFSVPQDRSLESSGYRSLAISCIPSYVARSFFFVTLCPPLHHDGRTLTYSSWQGRGWCRLEHMAAQLGRDAGCHIIITTANLVTLGWNVNGVCKAPAAGQFSVEADRALIDQVVLHMLWGKLQALLRSQKLHEYRFLCNLERFYFRGAAGIPSLVSDFETEIDPSSDPDSFMVARFLHDNLFRKVSDRDSAGWSPLCYAALTDRVSLVTALLNKRASVNDCTTKGKKEANLNSKLPVLSIATAFHSNQVVKLLLAKRAKVNGRDGNFCTALIWAGVADNGPAVRLLLDAKANPLLKSLPDCSPFRTACACDSVQAMKEMLIRMKVSLRFCLHTTLAMFGGCDAVSCLIQARADVNEPLHIPMNKTAWWITMKALHGGHYLSPSGSTYLAYHHYGATPLVFSILTGKLDTIPLLLKAGARLDIPNDRGKAPADFLQELRVPSSLSEMALVRGYSSEDSVDTMNSIISI